MEIRIKNILSLLVFLTSTICIAKGQSNISVAKYQGGNLKKVLEKGIKYPKTALKSKIEGDVILSILISKAGSLESIELVSSPNPILTEQAVLGLDQLENNWLPANQEGSNIEYTSLIVFRYKMFLDSQPPTFKKQAMKLHEKEKYEKAQKLYEKAIKYNPYDYQLFMSLSAIKNTLGDKEGSEKDNIQAIQLKSEIIEVVDIIAIGQSRIRQVSY